MGMQERSQLIGGVLEIRSTPDKGTTVTVRVPITGDEDA
jgi:signal transduction histidine kinase